jgi:hypothetical protein
LRIFLSFSVAESVRIAKFLPFVAFDVTFYFVTPILQCAFVTGCSIQSTDANDLENIQRII